MAFSGVNGFKAIEASKEKPIPPFSFKGLSRAEEDSSLRLPNGLTRKVIKFQFAEFGGGQPHSNQMQTLEELKRRFFQCLKAKEPSVRISESPYSVTVECTPSPSPSPFQTPRPDSRNTTPSAAPLSPEGDSHYLQARIFTEYSPSPD